MTAPTPQTNPAMNTPIIAASHDAFAPAAQSVSKATTLQIKMIVGQGTPMSSAIRPA
jgi:hypothetical protein